MNLEQFIASAQHLEKEIPSILARIVERLGEELLNAVIDEIYNQDLIDTGLMVNSFTRNANGNVWIFDEDRNAITLEVGSKLPYARYMNDGYTIEKAHFVPGYWKSGGGFMYDPEAGTGFMAKPRSFIGRKYYDIAYKNFEGGMKALIEEQLELEIKRLMG